MPNKRQDLPKISIITPSFNQGDYIEKTIQSVLSQKYPNLEYIIVDGGSTDETVDIIQRYQAQIHYWVSEPDRGQSHAINKGFAKATGDIMAWLCADDIYLPNALWAIANHFTQNPNHLFVYGDGWKIDSRGEVIWKFESSPVTTLDELYRWCYVFTPGAFWKRSLLDKVGGQVDEDLYYTMDWDLIIRFSKECLPAKIDGDITAVRVHENSKTITGVSGNAKARQDRDREVAKVSRKHAGAFCFNSVAYELKRPSELFYTCAPSSTIRKAVNRLIYAPIQLFCLINGNPKSAILNN